MYCPSINKARQGTQDMSTHWTDVMHRSWQGEMITFSDIGAGSLGLESCDAHANRMKHCDDTTIIAYWSWAVKARDRVKHCDDTKTRAREQQKHPDHAAIKAKD